MDQVAPTSTTIGELKLLADTAKEVAQGYVPGSANAAALMRIEQILRYAALVEEQTRPTPVPVAAMVQLELYQLGVKLPLVVAPGEGGFIHDARGNWIASIDMQHSTPEEGEKIARLLARAVNDLGGFTAAGEAG